jgi:hypothetical protein
VKFFFPDSHDLVDPSFDFTTERRRYSGSRQLAQHYAHEVFDSPPYDGMLVSKAVIDGYAKNLRYSFTQVQRLKRLGIREFLRLDSARFPERIATMGDCGSFTYLAESEPPFTVAQVLEFYSECQFDYGLSLDHVVLGYAPDNKVEADVIAEWRRRFEMTLSFADEFLRLHRMSPGILSPIGVAQGWSPASYSEAVNALQRMGYEYIALGGMVPLKSPEILACLEAIRTVRRPSTKLHLLGVSRFEQLGTLDHHGVASFDSTAPLKQAFMDDKNNYHTPTRAYTAVRVPQVGENSKLKQSILSGAIDQSEALRLEKACLAGVLRFAEGSGGLEAALEPLAAYEALWHGKKDDSGRYQETLVDRPWEKCPCSVCRALGVHVVIFRGAERNRRRGFHNLFVLRNRLNQHLCV